MCRWLVCMNIMRNSHVMKSANKWRNQNPSFNHIFVNIEAIVMIAMSMLMFLG